MINQDLSKALPSLSSRGSSGYLWIDQICIDQGSITERNQQVKIMGDIYKAGRKVLIWLGTFNWFGIEWSSREIQLLDNIFQIADRSIEDRESSSLIESKLNSCLIFPEGSGVNSDCHSVVAMMLAYPWFQRAWVFQEIILSPKATFIVGSIAVSSVGLYLIACKAQNMLPFCFLDLGQRDIPPQSRAAEEVVSILLVMLRAWADCNPLADGISFVDWNSLGLEMHFDTTLSTLVCRTLATVPLDRIYAFLGLNWRLQILLEPNYDITLREVLVDTVSSLSGFSSIAIFSSTFAFTALAFVDLVFSHIANVLHVFIIS